MSKIDLSGEGKFGAEARVNKTDTHLTIHFVETDHWGDWIMHLFAWPRVRWLGERVHKAWLASYLPGRDRLFDQVRLHGFQRTVVVSGFSYGGAIAQLFAHDLWQAYGNKLRCNVRLYGSPKSGVRRLQYPTANYRVAVDLVTLLPPFWPTAGEKYRLHNDGKWWQMARNHNRYWDYL